MKLVFYELNKVLSKKVFLLIFVLCLVLNAGIFYFSQQSSDNSLYITDEYDAIVSEYSAYDFDIAKQKLSEENLAYEMLSVINQATEAETQEELNEYLLTLEQYKKDNPKVYFIAENLSKSSDDSMNREMYIYSLWSQIKYIESYPQFIDEMYDRAQEQSIFPIFSNEKDFSYKNLYKTADDYQGLKNIELSIGNDLPITTALNYDISDYFLVAMIFLTCIYLFIREREMSLYNLLRSSQKGRFETISAKLCALFLITALTVVIFSITNFVMSTYLYGYFDLNRQIQSISDFRNCIFNVTVGQFCFFSVLGKILGSLFLASGFAMIFTIFSNTSLMYIIGASFLVVEYVLCFSIVDTTLMSYFKYINIFHYLNGFEFFGKYINLNLFSEPVSVYLIDVIFFTFATIVAIVVTILSFTLKSKEKTESIFQMIIESLFSKYFRIRGSVRIFSGEAYKYLVVNKMVFLFIAVIVLGIFTSVSELNYLYRNISDVAYEEYMTFFQGEITPEKEQYIKEQQEYFNILEQRMTEVSENESLSDETKGIVINTINNILETKGVAFDRINAQYGRLVRLNASGVRGSFIDENIYPSFINDPLREWQNMILVIVLFLISLPLIFAVEYKKGMINLIRPTQYGKFRLLLSKLSVAFVSSCIVFIAVYLPYFIRFILNFGVDSLFVPIVCLDMYQYGSGTISVIGAFLLNSLCYFFITLFCAIVIITLSVLLKNHMLSLITSTIILLIPCLLIFSNQLIRVGNMFLGNYVHYSLIIIFVALLLSLVLLTFTSLKFTNTVIRRKSYD